MIPRLPASVKIPRFLDPIEALENDNLRFSKELIFIRACRW